MKIFENLILKFNMWINRRRFSFADIIIQNELVNVNNLAQVYSSQAHNAI